MNIDSILAKIKELKEVTADERIELIDSVEAVEDKVFEARDLLGTIPDAEPTQKEVKDPRDAFVDDLMENDRTIEVRN